MGWLNFGIIALILLTAYNLVSKLFSSRISSLYALPFISLGVFIAALISLFVIKFGNIPNLIFSKEGSLLAILAGLLWGLGGIFYFFMFSKGVPLSVGLPFTVGGLTLLGSIVGILLLHEQISAIKILGICLLMTSLFLISKSS
ncbi:hypothetical protein KA001_02340 [Patescibacteria group bacterium]|nr:hypothetical protein [Patescibacteria group bacterium]